MLKRIPLLSIVCALAVVIPALANTTRQDDLRRMESSTEVFEDVMHMPDKGIPDRILRSAKCIAIIPGEKKAAFFVGGNYGKGLVTCRDEKGWSAPLFVSVGGGSFGFQWGATSTDLVIVFRSRSGLEKQLSDKFEIGADADVAAGPVGRNAQADTDIELHAEVLTYSRSRGVFAGVSLKGAVLQPDDSGNEVFYGAGVRRNAVLTGEVPVPQPAKPLVRALEQTAGARLHAEPAVSER